MFTEDGELIAVIRGLRASATAPPPRTDKFGDQVKLQVLRYHWEQGVTLAEPKRLGHWLVVGDAESASDFVASRLNAYGAGVTGTVQYGDDYNEDAGRFTVRYDSIPDAESVVAACGELDGIAFFSGLDRNLNAHDPTGQKVLNALMVFSRALCQVPPAQRPRVYVVTRAAFSN